MNAQFTVFTCFPQALSEYKASTDLNLYELANKVCFILEIYIYTYIYIYIY